MTTIQEPVTRARDSRDTSNHRGTASNHPSPLLPQSKHSRWPLWLGATVVLFALAVFLGIRSRQQAEQRLTEVAEQAATPTVNVTSPKPEAAAEEIALPGNTQAFNDTPIYARANGYLKKWVVDIGARVKAGDLLAEIEVPELDQQLHQAEADLQTAQANLDLARLTNTRWQDLLVHRVISSQEADQVKSDLGVKQATYVASEANVRRLQETQKYERVIAPFDGIITARGTDIGALVDSGTGAGRELFHLAAVHKLRVYVAVPEIYADSVLDGSKVTLTQSANAARTFTGTVGRNSSAIDQTTRTLNVEVDVDNDDGRLLPGSYVIVHFKLAGNVNSVTIPANALLFRSEGLRVAKVVNGTVSLTPITIGHDFGSTVEVTSGLTVKDVIVLDPSDSLAEGAHVEVNEPAK
ncbi:efflux transporter, RND family, MFP subunit [Chthoniobacter flavus Ellin428]|uniref:Efflux transporter, RND family, MFP subunit n=1 Tax=Chthoniobacter flavus Ellin428 TaxID=497964 RepID=B4DC65_9BACT|nr:efflux RND transporter periplasmic adaptor subunit [Chthoniobacter flavus]EDY15987.1 efflux transporter, RND family, MFP subunit [Chthoniobacter flavus Ellin428]TCO83301.1 RND family efflux transporter MFP subunit [Chthoniobacter flavus]